MVLFFLITYHFYKCFIEKYTFDLCGDMESGKKISTMKLKTNRKQMKVHNFFK